MNDENKNLADQLIQSGVLKTPQIINAFYRIDRKYFVPKEFAHEAYMDLPIPIGFGQTISQPTTVALMLELLAPRNGDKILDVGSGSGWTTALLSELVGENGLVFGVEVFPELVKFGQGNLQKYNLKNSKIVLAGLEIGFKEQSPFDRILVSASSSALPQELIEQLKTGGKIVIPIGNSIWKFNKKADGQAEGEEYPGFIFVPLKY